MKRVILCYYCAVENKSQRPFLDLIHSIRGKQKCEKCGREFEVDQPKTEIKTTP
jgi:hypothetical protein